MILPFKLQRNTVVKEGLVEQNEDGKQESLRVRHCESEITERRGKHEKELIGKGKKFIRERRYICCCFVCVCVSIYIYMKSNCIYKKSNCQYHLQMQNCPAFCLLLHLG